MTTDGDLLYLGTSNGKVVSVPIPALKESTSEQQFVLSQSVEVETEVVASKATKRDRGPPKDEKSKKEKHSRGTSKEKEDKTSKKVPKEDKLLKEKREEEKYMKEREEAKLMKEKREEEKLIKEKKTMAASRCLSFSAVAVHSHMDERVRDLIFLKLPELSLSKLKQAAEMMQYHSLPNLASPYGGRIPISPPILGFRSLVISVGKGHVEYIEETEEESPEDITVGIHRERHEAFQLLVWGHKNSI